MDSGPDDDFSGARDDMHRLLRDLIQHERIQTLFQPIADTTERSFWAYEALSRGPSDGPLHSPMALFATARAAHLTAALDFVCIESALRRATTLKLRGRLFLNLSPDTLAEEPRVAARLAELCLRHEIEVSRCVLELTEQGLLEDYEVARASLAELRDLGFEIAIDDFGSGYSGLKAWSELRPEYVKIDRYFASGVDRDPVKVEFIRSIIDMARAIGSRVIAEGVETAGECRELLDLGVDAVQGFFLARPERTPEAGPSCLTTFDDLALATPASTAVEIAVEVEPLSPETSVERVVHRFREDVDRDSLPVVRRDGRPIGIVHRDQLLITYSKPLHADVYNRKPITTLMDTRPLVVDGRLRLEQVSRLVTRKAHVRRDDDFIIALDGRYVGMARSVDLLRQITEQQVRAATYSNPLTMLPGTVPINECIDRLISQGRRFCVAYADLDHFKAYNDCYGYVKGDQVLMHLAEILKNAMCPRLDFVGHVGGDDFIAVLRSRDWQQRLMRVVESFEASSRSFYSDEHRASGGITAIDRDGRARLFPLLSVSLAVVDSSLPGLASAEACSQLLQPAKQAAKRAAGSSVVLAAGSGELEVIAATRAA